MGDRCSEEIRFWEEEFARYYTWLTGGYRDMYGIPTPDPLERKRVAVQAWLRADRDRYLNHLFMLGNEIKYWNNVLDVGCGPLPLVRAIDADSYYGLDPLWGEYRRIGYEPRIIPLEGKVEDWREMEDRFDLIVSVNAIDHVDDFEQAIEGVASLLASGGDVRIECHYHEPEPTEPQQLDDERVAKAFQAAGLTEVEKVSDVPFSYFYPPGYRPEEDRLTVWSNFKTGLEVFE